MRCLDEVPHALEALPEAGAIVGRLLARGFLDPDQIHQEAMEHDDAIQQRVARIVATGQAWQLQRATAKRTGSQRRRL